MRQCCIDKLRKEASERSSISSRLSSSRQKFNFSSKALINHINSRKETGRKRKKSAKKTEGEHVKPNRDDTIHTSVIKENATTASVHNTSSIHQPAEPKQHSKHRIRFQIEDKSEGSKRAKSSNGFKRSIKERINIIAKNNKRMHEVRRQLAKEAKFKNRKASLGAGKVKRQHHKNDANNTCFLPDEVNHSVSVQNHTVKGKQRLHPDMSNGKIDYNSYNQTLGYAEMPKFVNSNFRKEGFKSTGLHPNSRLQRLGNASNEAYQKITKDPNRDLRRSKLY